MYFFFKILFYQVVYVWSDSCCFLGAADGFVGLIEVRCFVFAGIGFVCCYFGWGILCFCFLTVAVSVICQLRGLFNSASVFVWVLRCRLYTAPCIAVLISYVRLVRGALIIYAVSKKKKTRICVSQLFGSINI